MGVNSRLDKPFWYVELAQLLRLWFTNYSQ